MTNSIIPYSFIPGTKAKANEINANFISLATSVDSSKAYTMSEISLLDEKLTKEISDSKTSLATKDLTNTNYFTNCVLEAPNGIADFEVTTITVKTGLKVLISDGRNENGTVKTINLTLENDLTYTPTIANETRAIFLNANSTISSYLESSVFISPKQPIINTTQAIWFNYNENIWYETNNTGDTWTKASTICIAKFKTDASCITSIENIKTLNFLKHTDKKTIMNWQRIDYSAGISCPLNINQQAKCDGFIITYGGANAMHVEICNISVGETADNMKLITYARIGSGANARQTVTIPVYKDLWYFIGANGSSVATFYPFKGELYE